MQEYYKKLYDEEGTSRLLDNENIFNTINIPQITAGQRDRLEQPLTEEELLTALKIILDAEIKQLCNTMRAADI